MKRTLIAVLLLASATAWGMDASGRHGSQGVRTCVEFLKESKTNNLRRAPFVAWASGYITAYNRQTPDTFDVLGSADFESVMPWIETWCKANPYQSLGNAMEAFTTDFYPRRYRTAKEAGR